MKKKVKYSFVLILILIVLVVIMALKQPDLRSIYTREDGPDFVFNEIDLILYDQGIKRWRLLAEKATVEEKVNLLKLNKVQGILYNNGKEVARINSATAFLNDKNYSLIFKEVNVDYL
ncbi:LPS export ABC transporter periplasmic protein LptC, partial [bacterium]|nr:LPS export ABC transporter periplasmic protein LptC [bacterium]